MLGFLLAAEGDYTVALVPNFGLALLSLVNIHILAVLEPAVVLFLLALVNAEIGIEIVDNRIQRRVVLGLDGSILAVVVQGDGDKLLLVHVFDLF